MIAWRMRVDLPELSPRSTPQRRPLPPRQGLLCPLPSRAWAWTFRSSWPKSRYRSRRRRASAGLAAGADAFAVLIPTTVPTAPLPTPTPQTNMGYEPQIPLAGAVARAAKELGIAHELQGMKLRAKAKKVAEEIGLSFDLPSQRLSS